MPTISTAKGGSVVGLDEVDLDRNYISWMSPLARWRRVHGEEPPSHGHLTLFENRQRHKREMAGARHKR